MAEFSGVLFDIGGVFVTDGPDMAFVTRTLGFGDEVGVVAPVVRHHRDTYDLGITDREYWDLVADALGVEPFSDETVAKLVAADRQRWATLREDTMNLVDDLAEQGRTLGVLSNAPHTLSRSFATRDWVRDRFSSLTFSCDLGIAKPDARVYAAACDAMGLDAEDVVFLDDRQVNVDAARAFGMQSVLWSSADEARDALAPA